MISFRYHLVTILAVFLALGLGILIGTTVVRQSLIAELENRAQGAIERTRRLEQDVSDLRTEVEGWQQFGQAAEELLLEGKLQGREAVLVTAGDVDLSEVDGVQRAIDDAGGALSGIVVVTDRMAVQGEGDAEALAAALGVSDALSASSLSRQAGSRLGVRLAAGAGEGVGGSDVLDALAAAGFVDTQVTGSDGAAGIGGPDQVVVVLSGGDTVPRVRPEDFFLPLVVSLTQAGHPVAAGETERSAYEFVSLIRDDAALDGQVLTVDNADTVAGRVALVLALHLLLDEGLPACEDFGVKPGACGLLPQPQSTP